MAEVELIPINENLIERFWKTLDIVARERKYLTLLEAPPLENTREFVLNGIEKGDPRILAVASDEVIGWCDIGRLYFPTQAHRGRLGMGILPQWRGRGIGKRLILAAVCRAWSSAFTRVELGVYSDNFRAVGLYRKIGFVEEGLERDAILVDGCYRDSIRMALIQRPASSSPPLERSP